MTTTHRAAIASAAFIGSTLALVAARESTAFATTITVNAANTVAGDHKCSFDEALNSLNGVGSKRDACPTADGNNDTISLLASSTPYNASISSSIYAPVTITGAGASSTTLQFTSPDDYEISIWLSGSGTVTVKNLTIQQKSSYILELLANYTMTLNISGVVIKNFHWDSIANESNLVTTITSSTLTNNGYGYFGDVGSSLSMTNSTVSNSNHYGIFDLGSSAAITNSTISGNAGGGIYSAFSEDNQSSLVINGSSITGNGLTNSPQYGGGVCNLGGATINNTAIQGNFATNGGGIYTNGQLMLTDSTIGANSAAKGGGLLVDFATANNGQSFYLEGGNNTLAFNSASQSGGGMELDGAGGGNTTHVACMIIADNSAPTGPDVSGDMADTSFGFFVTSESGTKNAPSDWIVKNPLLGTYSSGHYPLKSGSPALNTCSGGYLSDNDYGSW